MFFNAQPEIPLLVFDVQQRQRIRSRFLDGTLGLLVHSLHETLEGRPDDRTPSLASDWTFLDVAYRALPDEDKETFFRTPVCIVPFTAADADGNLRPSLDDVQPVGDYTPFRTHFHPDIVADPQWNTMTYEERSEAMRRWNEQQSVAKLQADRNVALTRAEVMVTFLIDMNPEEATDALGSLSPPALRSFVCAALYHVYVYSCLLEHDTPSNAISSKCTRDLIWSQDLERSYLRRDALSSRREESSTHSFSFWNKCDVIRQTVTAGVYTSAGTMMSGGTSGTHAWSVTRDKHADVPFFVAYQMLIRDGQRLKEDVVSGAEFVYFMERVARTSDGSHPFAEGRLSVCVGDEGASELTQRGLERLEKDLRQRELREKVEAIVCPFIKDNFVRTRHELQQAVSRRETLVRQGMSLIENVTLPPENAGAQGTRCSRDVPANPRLNDTCPFAQVTPSRTEEEFLIKVRLIDRRLHERIKTAIDEERVKHSEHTDGWKVLPEDVVRRVTTTVEDARQAYRSTLHKLVQETRNRRNGAVSAQKRRRL